MRTAQPFPLAHQPLSDPKASKNPQEALKSKSKNVLEIWFMAIAIPIVSLASFVERTITEDVLKFVEKDVDVQEVLLDHSKTVQPALTSPNAKLIRWTCQHQLQKQKQENEMPKEKENKLLNLNQETLPVEWDLLVMKV